MPQFSPLWFINLISWTFAILSFVIWYVQAITFPSILRLNLSRKIKEMNSWGPASSKIQRGWDREAAPFEAPPKAGLGPLGAAPPPLGGARQPLKGSARPLFEVPEPRRGFAAKRGREAGLRGPSSRCPTKKKENRKQNKNRSKQACKQRSRTIIITEFGLTEFRPGSRRLTLPFLVLLFSSGSALLFGACSFLFCCCSAFCSAVVLLFFCSVLFCSVVLLFSLKSGESPNKPDWSKPSTN